MDTEQTKVKVLFGAEYAPALLKRVAEAKKTIDILMFDWRWYQHEPGSSVQQVNQALAQATMRGVKVRAITNFVAVVEKLKEVGMSARSFGGQDLLHAKLVVIDRSVLFVGSHNFSKNGFEYNYETSVEIEDEKAAGQAADFVANLWLL